MSKTSCRAVMATDERSGPWMRSETSPGPLQCGPYGCIVEADIKGFFDTIDHQRLMEMLAWRSDDQPFLRLIRTWLKAGVLETDGQVLHPVTGTPQGGTVSPILAHAYLHYALDVWCEGVVKAHCEKAAYLCRYADDCAPRRREGVHMR